jgi:PKD repeat protein
LKNFYLSILALILLFNSCKKTEKPKPEEIKLGVKFESNSPSIFEGDTVKFSNLSIYSNSDITYSWNFDGGTPAKSTIKNPTVKYDKAGIFDVKLVVSSKNKKDSVINKAFVNVKIKEVINIETKFESNTSTIFEEESITYNNLSSSNQEMSYDWTFIGGTPVKSTLKNPIIRYHKSGYYDVKLVVNAKNKKDSLISRAYVNVKSSTENGLMLLFPLNGDALDYSGNQINGTISSLVTPAFGKSGVAKTAYQFTGNSGSSIQIPTQKLKLNNYSYCMYVYLDVLPSAGNQYMPFAIGNVGGDQHFQALNNVKDGNGWAFGGYNYNYQSFFKASFTPLVDQKWYFIIATRSNNKLSLYVDCKLVAEVSSSSTVTPNYSPSEVIAKLGCRYDGSFALKGRIDEFRIYNRALTETDINKLCDLGPSNLSGDN